MTNLETLKPLKSGDLSDEELYMNGYDGGKQLKKENLKIREGSDNHVVRLQVKGEMIPTYRYVGDKLLDAYLEIDHIKKKVRILAL